MYDASTAISAEGDHLVQSESPVRVAGRRRWLRILMVMAILWGLGAATFTAAYVTYPGKVRRGFSHLLHKARNKARRVVLAVEAALPRTPAAPGTRAESKFKVKEYIYKDGLKTKTWHDYGWAAKRKIAGPGPALLDFSNYGGWIIFRWPKAQPVFGGLVFRMKAPKSFGDFLTVRLYSSLVDNFPFVKIKPEHRRDLKDGWTEIFISMRELDPYDLDFERIVFSVHSSLPKDEVLLADIGFTELDGKLPPPAPLPSRNTKATIFCQKPAKPISPLIYGLGNVNGPPELNASAYRWGGNPTTRFNWKINAWNTASDWYYQNIEVKGWAAYLEKAAERNAYVSLTVPIIGWVAKDTSSVGFPISIFGPQARNDGYRPDAGNGIRADKSLIKPKSPTQTSVPASPAFVAEWVRQIRALDAKHGGKRRVNAYILDNEPMLWNSTHRDIHPEPVTYDELVNRTIKYGSAIRAADPGAVIVGPAVWGWPAYLYSAKDAVEGFSRKPDRKTHDDVPFIEYYLRKLKEHEKKTGVRVLDVLDVHFYPQGRGIYSDNADADTVARRLRSTRSLWDPTYKDESWIEDRIRLIPRAFEWINKNYPGLGFSIGEWNFGAEKHPSGGIALAEALGRFAQEGLTSAYYWLAPPKDTPAYWAFRAFRNYDGAGGRFLDWFVPAKGSPDLSVFASRDEKRQRLVIVVLNSDTKMQADLDIDFASCGVSSAGRGFSYWGNREGLALQPGLKVGEKRINGTVRPFSISVFEIDLGKK